MDPAAILVVKQLFNAIHEFVSRKEELKRDVSLQLRSSLTETEIYWGKLSREEPRDFDAEADLARKWSDTASISARHDDDVSAAALKMSRYWANPGEDPTVSIGASLAELWEVFREKRELRILHLKKPQ